MEVNRLVAVGRLVDVGLIVGDDRIVKVGVIAICEEPEKKTLRKKIINIKRHTGKNMNKKNRIGAFGVSHIVLLGVGGNGFRDSGIKIIFWEIFSDKDCDYYLADLL